MRHSGFKLLTGLAITVSCILLTSCELYHFQSDPYVDPVQFFIPQTFSSGQIAISTFYNTQNIQFNKPVWFGEYPGEEGAFMVAQQDGNLFLLEPLTGGFKKTAFGQVPAEAGSYDGLLGLAFHPGFKDNHKYYVYYNTRPRHGLLQERMADPSFKGDSNYSRDLLWRDTGGVDQGHSGGDIHFGKDGYLYLAFGDGSNPGEYVTNSQDLRVLYGKMIRIDVNRTEGDHAYGIPADNPFYNSADPLIRKEIYAYGFRNPWRWSFDPVGDQMLLGDVGNEEQEEVDLIVKGGNYGWRTLEGTNCFNDTDEASPLNSCNTAGMISPLVAIPHSKAGACIIGGYVYRGNPASPLNGTYVFGDYMTRGIYSVNPQGGSGVSLIGTSPTWMSSFGTDSKGNIYLVGYYTGTIYRLNL